MCVTNSLLCCTCLETDCSHRENSKRHELQWSQTIWLNESPSTYSCYIFFFAVLVLWPKERNGVDFLSSQHWNISSSSNRYVNNDLLCPVWSEFPSFEVKELKLSRYQSSQVRPSESSVWACRDSIFLKQITMWHREPTETHIWSFKRLETQQSLIIYLRAVLGKKKSSRCSQRR